MCQKSKDMFANAVFLPNIPKLDQKNYDQTTKWELVRRSLPSQMEVQVRKGGRHHHRTKVSREWINLQSFWWKSYKKLLAGATSAACGKASSPPWRRHHRRWASRYYHREADIESALASQVRNHEIWWNHPMKIIPCSRRWRHRNRPLWLAPHFYFTGWAEQHKLRF